MLWTLDNINKFLDDSTKRRGVDPTEYEFLSKHLNQLNIDVFVDVGCFLGVSTHILGTSIKNPKVIYAIEDIDSETFCPYLIDGKPIEKREYCKYAPKGTIFKKQGYHYELPSILNEHKDDIVFVFLDAVKKQFWVMEELEMCYIGGADYVAVHDTSIWYKHPRKAMKRSIRFGWFELMDEINIGDGTTKMKGVTLLRRKK